MSFETSFEGDLEVQITFSAMAEFVSRRYAVFSASTDLGADLKVRFTFSAMAEFVKWAKKKRPRRRFEVAKSQILNMEF